ncbi:MULTISPECIES: double-strand break repair protein AddB [Hyphobacterium]|uniref:Double-strand break repair protein AddB n=1 Tax=Hyphobacterium vulgare TaxID=1736751 RepID=A0ABV6ZXW2_9PROT
MTDSVFKTPSPRIFTLPPGSDFLRAVARQVLAETEATGPESLADITILTPTRRAGRALIEAFAAERGGKGAAILPMIRPIGDVDADEPPFEPGELADAAAPAIDPARRHFELTRLILAREEAAGRTMTLGAAMALAEPLAVLIDDYWTEETGDFAALGEQIASVLPAHLQESVDFLSIVGALWPKRLAELGMSDPAQRRSALLRALAERWRETPPRGPVFIAGSTGSIPAAADLMAAAAMLEKGCVILPGLDTEADDAAWDAIDVLDSQHPQWPLKAFLDRMGVRRGDVKVLPSEGETDAMRARQRVIAEALRPAEETADWLKRIDRIAGGQGADYLKRGFDGLSLLEAPGPDAEALAIALMLRETLDTPGKTAMVVTPDRALARRVSAHLQRFGIKLDDSAGLPLSGTGAGGFLQLVLDLALEPGSALAFTALAASPLFALGQARDSRLALLRAIDIGLRGPRPGLDFAALKRRLTDPGNHARPHDPEPALALIDQLDSLFTPLLHREARPAADWARAHAQIAEALTASDRPGTERLWAGEGGEAAADLIRSFLDEAETLPDLTLVDYAAAWRDMAGARRVRPQGDLHPRLKLLGPLEARGLSADLVILAGLNEGVWPAGLGADPWMSRGMRLEAGLGAPERRIGLSAHDFAQAAAAPEAILTRSTRVDGAPAVASRWVWRLEMLARGTDADGRLLKPGRDWLALAGVLDRPESVSPAPPPAPTPPAEARPTRLSVTAIRKWIRDPYAIYAGQILRLKKLDAADLEPEHRERGSAWHGVFEAFVREFGDRMPENAESWLAEHGAAAIEVAGFDDSRRVQEEIRFARAARYFLDWHRARLALGLKPAGIEVTGSWSDPETGFTLHGRADRIDRTPDGCLDLIDYKTGVPPKPKATKAGFEPQLPLTALIGSEGGFEDVDAGEPGGLIYVRISGGAEPGEEVRVDKEDPSLELRDQYLGILRKLIAEYADAATPYLSQPRAQYTDDYGDFDQLARRGEWADSAAGDGKEEAS